MRRLAAALDRWAAMGLLAALAAAQERGPAIAEALRTGDRAAAEAIAAAEPQPERRALMEAALQPIHARAAAFLSVAQRFKAHDVCGEALLAGLATAAQSQRRWPGELPPLDALAESLGDEWWRVDGERIADDLAVVLPSLLHAVRQWAGERPDAEDLPLLLRLARWCACQVVMGDPMPIESRADWPLPRPLGEDLLISVRRLGDELPSPLGLVDALARESTRRWVVTAKDTPAALPSPGDGRWLLEVQSVSSPWRALRVVDVGSLSVAALADEGVLLFGAFDGRWCADDSILCSLWRGGSRLPEQPSGGVGVWRLAEHSGSFTLQVRRGDQRARVPVWLPKATSAPRPLAVAHWQCDRPLQRPGDPVQGRVVVRAVAWADSGLAAVPTTAVPPAAGIPLQCTWPDGTRTQHVLALDARGMAPFVVPVPASAPPGPVHAELGPLPNGAMVHQTLTEVAAFRRPAVVGELRAPPRVAATDGSATLHLQVTWASGGPAADVLVDVVVASSHDRRPERRQLATAADGSLVIPVDVRDRAGERIECRCELRGPDGHVERIEHTFVVEGPATQVLAPPQAGLGVAIRGTAVVGQQVTLELRAAAWDELLVVVGRGRNLRVAQAVAGRDGTGVHAIDVLASDWPRLDVAVLGPGGNDIECAWIPVRLSPPRGLQLEVPATARPKEAVRCRATAGPFDLVTFAVVDERMFALRPDPTQTPDEALRPFVPRPQWRLTRSEPWADPRLLFGELLVDGRVPGPGDARRPGRPSPGGAASAGPRGPVGLAGELRDDFRATACFRTVVADARGIADLAFELPDDVTTWRVTATAVDANGEGALATATFATRLPLVGEAQLPRVLRVGDRCEVPLVLDRAATAPGDDEVRYRVEVTGAARGDGDAAGQRQLARGNTAVVTFPLAATEVGEAAVRSEVRSAAFAERSERRLPVLSGDVQVTVATAAAARGNVELSAPADLAAGTALQVDVLAGGAAAWHVLAARLQEYPYGCVEQTLSRMLPFAVGTAVPGDDTQRAARIGKGMARLRQLQRGDGGAFAWWPGDQVDLAMTGLVLHGLALLRNGGVDAAAYGLRVDVAALGELARLEAAPVAVEHVELLAGMLRFSPERDELRAAAAAIVDRGQPLPRGAALRLGLALVAAGDVGRAQRCRGGLPLATDPQSWFPGSDPTVHRAHELELDRALGVPPDPAAEVALVQDLLSASCRTYTDAVALLALGPSFRHGGKDLQVEVAVDGATSLVALSAEHGFRASNRFDGGGRQVAVRCQDRAQLLFVRVAGSARRAGEGPAWASPLVVERRCSGPGVVAAADGLVTVRAGEAVHVTLRVRTPLPMRYVALVCPLPAGGELLGEGRGLQRFDDRIAAAWSSLRAGEVTCEFDFVPTLTGDVLWPPAIIEAMYEPSLGGGCAGARLRVLPREARPAAGPTAPFLQRAPVVRPAAPAAGAVPPQVPPSLAERLAAAASLLSDTWYADLLPGGIHGYDGEPDPELQAQLDAACALLGQHAADDAMAVLRYLDPLQFAAGRQRGAALAPWRRGLLARIRLLQEQCLDAVVAQCERHLADEDARSMVRATVRWLPPARAEPLALRALLAMAGDVEACVDLVDVLPRELHDERLLRVLAVLLASGSRDVDALLERLPEAHLEAVAPSVLAELFAHTDDHLRAGLVRVLSRSTAGRRLLHDRLAAGENGEDIGELFAAVWPSDACAGLPATAWAALAEHDEAKARVALAQSDVPTAELWRWLQQRGNGLPLTVVAGALRARRAVPARELLAPVPADPVAAALLLALAAERDAAVAPAALAAARPLIDDEVEPALREVIGGLVAASGDVATVTAFADWLDDADWRLLWRRLTAAEGALLLQHDGRVGHGLPVDDTVLVRLLQRAADRQRIGDAVSAIATDPAGFDRLLGVRARLEGPVREQFDTALGDRLGYDARIGAAHADAVDRVVEFAGHHGWASAWPAPLAAARGRLLALRGLR